MSSNYLLISIVFLSLGFLAFIPYMTRKTESFGVSIPIKLYNRDDFKKMRKNYALIVLCLLLSLSTLIVWIGFNFTSQLLYMSYIAGIFVYLLGGFLIYLPFHRKMKTIKADENWLEEKQQTVVIDTSFREEKLVVSYTWFIIPFLVICGTFFITFFLYNNIPEQIPIHTDIGGKVTYTDKSIGPLLIMPVLQLVMLGIFMFVNYIMSVSKQQVSAENPTVSKRQIVLFRRRWSVFMLISGTMTIMLLLFIQLTFIYPELIQYEDIVIFTVIGFILIGTFILSVITGQGGSRINVEKETNNNVIDRDEDENWKLGQFYFNKDDPAIFIEKRFGVGWTNNWARPMSWLLLLIILAVALLPLLLLFI